MPDHAPASLWLLKPLQIAALPESIPITEEGATLGRGTANAVTIPNEGYPHVSSHHARIWTVDQRPVVEDLGSRNGTLVNGRPVQRRALRSGDIVQLGNMGPRFAVVCTSRLDETVDTIAIPAPAARSSVTRDLTQSALIRIKKGLGIPKDADVDTLIRRRGRRAVGLIWVAVAVVAVAAGVSFWLLSAESRAETVRLREISETLALRIAEARAQLEEERALRTGARRELEREAARLTARLAALEKGAGASEGKLEELRAQLVRANAQLERFDPISLEASRLREVRRVTRAVVFIETRLFLEHRGSGRRVHVRESEDGRRRLNLEGKGEPYKLESSGSGFCVGAEGWILTNAHVVEPHRKRGGARKSKSKSKSSSVLRPAVEIAVVFSGESERRPARLIKSVHDGHDDVALLKIEPFAGMPHLESLDLDRPPPEPGAEVFLAGFPLGTTAFQDGNLVIASTFKGILSRVVSPYLQVDAAVHPGNSGGPAMDGSGRVLGIVTRVQRGRRGAYLPTIGYVLPAATLRLVWPPPAEAAAERPQGEGKKKE